MKCPSIFNDVIGPVMRGPSSSHCAASNRIGLLARALMSGDIQKIIIEYDKNGSLAATHASQGVDIGLFAGFMGWDVTDERLLKAETEIASKGIDCKIKIHDFKADHPNTYRISLSGRTRKHTLVAISTGGGIIEVTQIDQIPVQVNGDYFECFLFFESLSNDDFSMIQSAFSGRDVILHRGETVSIIEIKSNEIFGTNTIAEIEKQYRPDMISMLKPVLPILGGSNRSLPFEDVNSALDYAQKTGKSTYNLALAYEAARGGIEEQEVFCKMKDLFDIMKSSIQTGLSGTQYDDRILGYQSGSFQKRMNDGTLIEAGILNHMVLYITALMEVKSAFGIIVASPTAGSCGALPGSILAAGDYFEYPDDKVVEALLVAGLIGVFIARDSTFAAELAGCQAECGAASGMTAAAFAYLGGGDVESCFNAASMALQNVFGMTCDPVANRVEVPCLGKNVMAASNALTSANMVLAGFEAVVPLDETIYSFDQVGRSLPKALRCTGYGGLSITKTSKKIEDKLAGNIPKTS